MYNTNNRKDQHWVKRLALAFMLVLVCMLLSSCYTDPQNAFDNVNGLNLDDNPTFQTVITNTPEATNTPTPTPTHTPTPTPTQAPQNTPGALPWKCRPSSGAEMEWKQHRTCRFCWTAC